MDQQENISPNKKIRFFIKGLEKSMKDCILKDEPDLDYELLSHLNDTVSYIQQGMQSMAQCLERNRIREKIIRENLELTKGK